MSSKNFDPHYWNLETLFQQIYYVPIYQRPYSWDKDQVQVLLDDLKNAYQVDKDMESGYYNGNIIIHDMNERVNGNINKFEIVDGQQRLTTFTLILLSIYCQSIEKKIPSTDLTVQKIKGALWKIVNRKYVKEYQTVNLNSIEKTAFKDLYDYCFDAEKEGFNIVEFCKNYVKNNSFEERIFTNFDIIYRYIEKEIFNSKQCDEILSFADYLFKNAQFIVIETNCPENQVFSIFESINSKGKKLDEIDLIKTYIFSNLDSESYDHYLKIWGNLIVQTNDNLYDYLVCFIKAYIVFYRADIKIAKFKIICRENLKMFYGEQSLSNALKKFLEDLYSKVKYFQMLLSADEAYNLVKSDKLRYYFKVYVEMGYKHPNPLFLRTLIEYSEGKIEKSDVIEIVSETIKFMLKFLTICGKDSKDIITMFSYIMTSIYEKRLVSKEIIVNSIVEEERFNQKIKQETVKETLQDMDAYEKNKIAIVILSLYESVNRNVNGEIRVSYDQAYLILNSATKSFSIDHLLVQTPQKNSEKFKYYCDDVNNRLVLKNGSDFPAGITTGMDYDVFTGQILNKIGNLRICYKDKNSARHNNPIALPEYSDFITYAQVEKRGKDIAEILVRILELPQVDITKLESNSAKRREEKFPKMDDLIESGYIQPGDELYIINYSENSMAKLIDSKYVFFNGEKITLNDWGCKVTGWKSIRIYTVVARVGERETLHQKREKLLAQKRAEITE